MVQVLAFLVFFCGLFGLAIGSFLNVVIVRVPEGRSVMRPPSACPRCNYVLRPWDNIPIVSWLLLRAKCRGCKLPIPARYPIVEALTGALFALAAGVVGFAPELPAVLLFVAGGVALAAIDLDTMRLPRQLVYVTLALVGGALTIAAIATGEWSKLVWAVVGSVVASGAFWLLRLFVPRGFGAGDGRLALVLGAITGWYGPGRVVVGLFFGFLIGSIVGLIVAARAGRMKNVKMPFGPSLVAGAFAAVLFGGRVVSWYRDRL